MPDSTAALVSVEHCRRRPGASASSVSARSTPPSTIQVSPDSWSRTDRADSLQSRRAIARRSARGAGVQQQSARPHDGSAGPATIRAGIPVTSCTVWNMTCAAALRIIGAAAPAGTGVGQLPAPRSASGRCPRCVRHSGPSQNRSSSTRGDAAASIGPGAASAAASSRTPLPARASARRAIRPHPHVLGRRRLPVGWSERESRVAAPGPARPASRGSRRRATTANIRMPTWRGDQAAPAWPSAPPRTARLLADPPVRLGLDPCRQVQRCAAADSRPGR